MALRSFAPYSARALAAAIAASFLAATGSAAAELKVTVTIKPIHALVAQVMEGVAEPALLVTGSASPHTYALKPSDAKALYGSDVVFRVSENIEPFTRKIVASLPASVRVVTLADSPGIKLLDVRSGETFEAHVHGLEIGQGPHHDHEEGEHHADGDHDEHADHDDGHHNSAHDGHVWLDPQNARAMIADIARVLAEVSPADAERFRNNAARATAGLDRLQAEIARDIEPIKGKPYVVFHDAYQYFEQRFGLAAIGSITVSPEAQPSAKRLTEIRRKLTALQASCVFSEPLFQPNLVAAVIEGTNAHSGTLDPEGALLEPGPGAYEALIRNLAAGLKSCLVDGS